ncbi:MAG: dihydroorotate dehydrogenase-like protein, partial [Planctomycetes bacterium]|nr:dihydroorotate dehydrogenase-like protein [Planctomycetota bacterium]
MPNGIELSTTYLGLPLRNPLVVSASPLCEDLANLRAMEDAGAAAIVLQSLFEEQLTQGSQDRSPGTPPGKEGTPEGQESSLNMARYNQGPEGYLEHVRRAKAEVGIPVIASLNGSTPGGWVRYAREIEKAGADALELNVYYVPNSPEVTGATIEQMYCDLVALVKAQVRIPVAVKLAPYFSSLPNMANRLDQAGAEALVLFNRFYQPDFNLDDRGITPTLTLSNPQELLLRLHWVAVLHGRLRADLAITGGIHTAQDVVKALMAGARAAMLTSALLEHGIGYLVPLRDDLVRWLGDHGF